MLGLLEVCVHIFDLNYSEKVLAIRNSLCGICELGAVIIMNHLLDRCYTLVNLRLATKSTNTNTAKMDETLNSFLDRVRRSP